MVSESRVAAIPLFADLYPAELAGVAAGADELVVDSGAVLTSQGDFGHGFFAVEAGTADVVVDDEVVASLGPGDTFGEIALLKAGRRTATVTATSPMRLLTFFKTELWRMESDLPEVAASLRAAVASRLSKGMT
jgi:CRP-like cAMP-binding protein